MSGNPALRASVIYNRLHSLINAATSRQLCLTESIIDIGGKVLDRIFQQ